MRLTPILSEAERFGDEDADAARYAVAVVRVGEWSIDIGLPGQVYLDYFN